MTAKAVSRMVVPPPITIFRLAPCLQPDSAISTSCAGVALIRSNYATHRVPVCVLDVPSNPKAAPFVLKVMPSNLEQCMAEMRAFADSEARPSDGDARVRLGMARLASGNFRRTVFDLSAAASMGNCSDKPRLQAEL